MIPIDVFTFDVGGDVICDACGKDWSSRVESGGIYGLMTKAFCPDCAPQIEADAIKYGEQNYIRARCPANKSFADWVREDLR